MSGTWQEPIVRIWAKGGDATGAVGTGLLVETAQLGPCLLTCAHVVNAALGGDRGLYFTERPGEQDLVLFDVPFRRRNDGRPHAARIVEWFPAVLPARRGETPVSDIALLRVLDPGAEDAYASLPAGLRLVRPEDFVFFDEDASIGADRAVTAYGYARPDGAFASGLIAGGDGNGWLHLVGSKEDGGDFIAPGFSGAPLFDIERLKILGMAVAIDGAPGKRIAFLQSTRNLWRACPQIARPYRGLRPFEERDAPFFFGRKTFETRMLKKAASFPILGVSAASGAGKSSVIRAGLLPRLKVGQLPRHPGGAADPSGLRCSVLVMRPANDPWKELARAITLAEKPSASRLEIDDEADRRKELLRKSPQKLIDYAKALLQDRHADRLVIVVDQFEELFTLAGHAEASESNRTSELSAAKPRDDFRNLMVGTATLRDKPSIQWIYSLRADFSDRVFAHRPFADAVCDSNELLAEMTQEELREAIGRPAHELDVGFEGGTDHHPGLLERIAADAGSTTGALPLMQHVLAQLWRRLASRRLSHANYDALGGVSGALGQHAEAVFQALTEAERKLAPRLFSRLVNVKDDGEATRRIARRSELGEDRWSLALKLAGEGNRLLVVTDSGVPTDGLVPRQPPGENGAAPPPEDREAIDAGGANAATAGDPLGAPAAGAPADPSRRFDPTAEVAHEALLRHWPRLKDWVVSDQRFLLWRQALGRSLAEHDKAADKDGTWLTGGPLQTAIGYTETRSDDLSGPEQHYIQTSKQRHDAEIEQEKQRTLELEAALRKAKRSRRMAGIAAVALFALSVGLGRLFYQYSERAAEVETANANLLAANRQKGDALARLNVAIDEQGKALKTAEQAKADALAAQDSAEAARDKAEIDASRYAAAVANQLIERGELVSAIKIVRSSLAPEFSKAELERKPAAFSVLAQAVSAIEQDRGILRGHGGAVTAAAFSPDGSRIVTASWDGTARLWDAATGRQIDKPMRHDERVNAVAFSPDDSRIVTASWDNTARLWDAATGEPIGEPMRHDGAVYTAAFSPDGSRIVTASSDRTARLWDAATGKPSGEPMRHEGPVIAASFSPDGTRIVTASGDKTARLWDAATGKPIGEPMRHQSRVNSAAFSPDGGRIVTASEDYTARLWDAVTAKPIGEPMPHDDSVIAVAFSPDDSRVVTASWDNTARLWDAATGKAIGGPLRHKGGVLAAAYSPDGSRIVTAAWDNTARLWDAASGQPIGEPMRHKGNVSSAVFSPDGSRIVTASIDMTARLWDATTAKPIGEPMGNDDPDTAAAFWPDADPIVAVAFSPDGSRVVIAFKDPTARLWDTATGKQIGEPMRHDDIITAVAFSVDGDRVVTASRDGTVRLWGAATGKPIGEPMRHDDAVRAAAVSPDGLRVATASRDGIARLWDSGTGKPVGEPMRHDDAVRAVAFSPDGGQVVTSSRDGTARLWNAATGNAIGEPMRHEGPVKAAAFSSDGAQIITASDDRTARLWDAGTEKQIGESMRHDGAVTAAAFSPDGKRIVTASQDGTARLWDATGKQIGEPMRHDHVVTAAAFSPDGSRIVTVSTDKSARLWDAASAKLIGRTLRSGATISLAAFSSDVTRILTSDENGTVSISNVSPAAYEIGPNQRIRWSSRLPFSQTLLDRADAIVPFRLTEEERRIILQEQAQSANATAALPRTDGSKNQ